MSKTLVANIKRSISINFLERKLVSTDIVGMDFSKNINPYFLLKKKLIKAICIIYIEKKEIKILVINVFFKNMIIMPNEKLAILNIIKETRIKWKKCAFLNRTERGDNSFGSSGI
ncbi:dCTP deaminase/dUTPase family protein [Blattabacterium cuenoti]|uniref:dUTP diphosphatase n=1 Tax=Blattabacterium cuenoti TaxID=1653831 RepID=UPI001EE9D7C1|nr:dUTP diphosphatase [Blattabacterium cuenoti]